MRSVSHCEYIKDGTKKKTQKIRIKYGNMNVIISPIVVTISNNILPHLSMCQCINRLYMIIIKLYVMIFINDFL